MTLTLAVRNCLDAGVYVNGVCSYVSDVQYILYRLLAYSVVPLVIITILYTLTAGRLARSARGMLGEIRGHGTHKRARIKSAKVLVSLVVVFALSYMPYFLISYFATPGIIVKNCFRVYWRSFLLFCCSSTLLSILWLFMSTARSIESISTDICLHVFVEHHIAEEQITQLLELSDLQQK